MRILAIFLPDSQKYATYDNTAFFSRFQEKKDFIQATKEE